MFISKSERLGAGSQVCLLTFGTSRLGEDRGIRVQMCGRLGMKHWYVRVLGCTIVLPRILPLTAGLESGWRADSGPSSRIKASARGITQARVPLAKSPIVACPSSIQDPIRVYAVLERPELPANLPAYRFTSFFPRILDEQHLPKTLRPPIFTNEG